MFFFFKDEMMKTVTCSCWGSNRAVRTAELPEPGLGKVKGGEAARFTVLGILDDSENKTTTTTSTSRHCGAGAFLRSAWPERRAETEQRILVRGKKKKKRTNC